MKKLFLVLTLWLGLIGNAEALIARGVGPAPANTASPGTTCVMTLPGTTIGRMLVIAVSWYDFDGPHTISSITVSGESINATVVAGSKVSEPSGTNYETGQIAYHPNLTAGGTKTITVTFNNNTYGSCEAMEYSGQNPTSQPDAVTTFANNDGSGATTCNTNITTTTANALIVGLCANNNAIPTVGAGYTIWGGSFPQSGSGFFPDAEDNVNAGAAGSKNVVFQGGIFSYAYLSVVSFKAAAGPASTIRHRANNQ